MTTTTTATLTGSEKQIAWAENIRTRMLQQLDAEESRIECEIADPDVLDQYRRAARNLRGFVENEVRAERFIDRRNRPAQLLVEDEIMYAANGCRSRSAIGGSRITEAEDYSL